ncbi:response regulator [Deinococcus navajonensis]|uniref:Response regulator n=1 Tax=Deinococcus navajonensis TaxID=309884 RepID=A0ABV8XJL1_9DEIO
MTVPFSYLLIDDNPEDRLLAEEAFEQLCPACTLTCVGSGREAIALLRTEGFEPDVVLLDVNMPGMDGFETLQRLKSDDRLSRIPVVMLTTSQASQDIHRAYSLFASSYLVKATCFDEFLRQLEAFLTYWKASRVARQQPEA